MTKYEWSRTDTAAIMFCSLKTHRASRVYRLDAVLKDEEVNPERLKTAVKIAVKRLPQFLYRAERGFFWYHLKKAELEPAVKEETMRPSVMRNIGIDGHPEFEILYYKRRISVEGSHELADATGYSEFLKTILAEYFNLSGIPIDEMDGIRTHMSDPAPEEWENPCEKYATNEIFPKNGSVDAYYINMHNKSDIIAFSGITDVEDVKRKAAENNVTITAYIIAVMILAVIHNSSEPIRKTIAASVPVNVRHFFPSETTRNFSSEVRVHFNPDGRTDWTIEEICNGLRGQIAARATKQAMQAFINSTYAMTQNTLLACVPYFIKKPIIASSSVKMHTNELTLNISNIGVFKLPPVLTDKIERIELVCGDPELYGMTVFTGVSTINDKTAITFTQSHRDFRFVSEFYKLLNADGVTVRVESSEAMTDFNSKAEAKKCTVCGVETAPEYDCCPLCNGRLSETAPLIRGVKTAVYPAEYNSPAYKIPKSGLNFSKEFFNAYFMLK